MIDLKKPVYVYRNLTAGKKAGVPIYSVMQGGRVVARVKHILLKNVSFIVRSAGREKVLREKRKNVHAFVKGFVARPQRGTVLHAFKVRYNPYEAPYFVAQIGDPGLPIMYSPMVQIDAKGIRAGWAEKSSK